MALDQKQYQRIHREVFGDTDYEPIVTFYDHASYNEELTRQSGRPRFTEVTYTLIKPTHPDLKTRDEVSHPTREEEKVQFHRQWEDYQKRKQDEIEFKPPLQAIPGMKLVYFRELQELEIYNAEDLANYEGDLGEINHLKGLAQRIMEVSNEARNLHERREDIQADSDRQQYRSKQTDWGSTVSPIGGQTLREEVTKEKAHGQKESFSYTFQI